MNNPFSATDPTGYFSLKKWFKPLLQVAIAIGTAGASLAIQAIAMGVSAFVLSGGDARAGLVAAATAGMFHAVGTAFGPAPQNYLLSGYHMGKILSHGIVGGISAKLGGGNFADGFRSAAVTQAFAPGIDRIYKGETSPVAVASRIAAAAIAGGTASAAGGGKFANGAVTGAFSRAFNDEAEKAKENIKKPLLNNKQTENIFRLSGYSDVDSIVMSVEAQQLATDMYFAAVEQHAGMSWIRRLFEATAGGWQTAPREILETLATSTVENAVDEYFQVGDYATIEARYAATGAGLMHQTAALHAPRYRDLERRLQ